MTVCIAATCEEPENQPCVVLCRDWRGELPGVGSNEELMKIRRLSDTWVALIADNISRAEELCLRIEYSLKKTPFTEENIADELRKIYNAEKKSMADNFLQNKYGFSLETLIDKGKTAFGEDFVNDCFRDIANLSIPADLLVVGFVEMYEYDDKKSFTAPVICSVSEKNEGDPVVREYEFSVIGSGGHAARTMLFLREQNCENPLMQTVYTLYEAKLISETVPGVGDQLSIDIFRPDGSLQTWTEECAKRCRDLFGRFGPHRLDSKTKKDWFKLGNNYFEPWAPSED